MMSPQILSVVIVIGLMMPATAFAQWGTSDTYTEYQMMEPGSGKLRIYYWLTGTRPGTQFLTNGIAEGGQGIGITPDVEVYDPQTGLPLKFDVWNGRQMKEANTPSSQGAFQDERWYIRIHLPKPVPEGGEGRAMLVKTYYVPSSYFVDQQTAEVVYSRDRGGLSQNSIVLPPGYTVSSSNTASQYFPLPDGRIKVAFVQNHQEQIDVVVRGKKTNAPITTSLRFPERAFNNDETLFDLGDPAANSYNVTHDYTEYTVGNRSALRIMDNTPLENVQARDLDSGKPLRTEKQNNVSYAILDDPVATAKESARVRVTGKRTDPSYKIEANELNFEQTFRAVRNTVLLPAGWVLVAANAPATIHPQPNGRVGVHFVNTRAEDMKVQIRARRAM
jgi:hypothetical protein